MQLNRPLISVIVPVYNVVRFLDRCVESIVAQTYPKIEILLVDDGSTDGSSLKCDSWADKDDRISVMVDCRMREMLDWTYVSANILLLLIAMIMSTRGLLRACLMRSTDILPQCPYAM